MIAHWLASAALCALTGCARATGKLEYASLPAGPAALVRAGEAVFVFPTPDSLRPCDFRRPADPDLALYIWTVNVGGPGRGPWYAVDVFPEVRDSAASGRPPTLAAVLHAARPAVVTVAGEPPMTSGVIDAAAGAVEARAVGGRVIVRLTRAATVARLFAGRPHAVRFVACHDGDDSWTRSVPVQYEP